MSDFISENISKYKDLSAIYKDSVYESLKTPKEKLEKIFMDLLDEKSNDYSLKKENSVYTSKYYQIKHRIKEPDNFYEKLIRKNIGLHFTTKFDLINNPESLESRKPEIIAEMQILDDIIGLRIVTELKKDCSKVYELLENSADFFQKEGIKLKDLKGQPQKMKNGLEIYRIKGIFQGQYGFELQIKSKVDEAWGDLDHTLFYKDYSISPIKDTVQVTMNNVGGLLDKIEHLLYDLRESGSNYIENTEHLKFQEKLEEEVSLILKDKFKTSYRLKEISHYLKFFKENLDVKTNKLTDLDYSHLKWSGETLFTKSYIKIRDSNFDLIIIETLYFNWRKLVEKGNIIEENYEADLYEYLRLFTNFISDNLKEEEKESFLEIIKTIATYSSSSDIFLSIVKHHEVKEACGRLDFIANEEDEVKQGIAKLKTCFQINMFNGNIGEYLISIMDDLDIGSCLIKIKDAVKGSKDNVDKNISIISSEILDVLQKITNHGD